MKAIAGSPLERGKSDVIRSALCDVKHVGGIAVSPSVKKSFSDQLTVKEFDGSTFAGFVCGNDAKNNSCSVITHGLNVPLIGADSESFTVGQAVGVDADGRITDEATAVYVLNATVEIPSVTIVNESGTETTGLTVNLYGGGGVAPVGG